MKLKELKVTNFRNMEDSHFEFIDIDGNVRNFTVLIGNNGDGKTAILEAIAKALVPVIRVVCKEAVKESDLRDSDIKCGTGWTSISLTTILDGLEYSCTNRRKTKGTSSMPISVTKDTLKNKYKECMENGYLPLVLYYGTDRVVRDIPLRGHIREYKIEHALKNCFNNASYFRDFYDWFKTEEETEFREQRENPNFKNKKLDCVREAIEKMIPEYKNLRIRANPSRMVVTDSKQQDLRIEQLSDGYKAVLSMVSDIAKRLAIANPDSENPLNEEAIILVDELDLHLHPKWQKKIVSDLKRTFLNCQFIVSTHSPFIIQSLDKNEVIDVDRGLYQQDAGSYEGWSLEEIQEHTMGVETKTDKYHDLLKEFSTSMDNEDFDKARLLYVELKNILHPTSTERKIIDMDMRSVELDD